MSKEKDRQPFISVRDLKKYFCLDNYKLAKAKTRYIHAVDDVSFDIYKGEIFGIIGESGSGKSTIGRCVLKLIDVDSGEIYFDGKNITHVSRKEQQSVQECKWSFKTLLLPLTLKRLYALALKNQQRCIR